MTRRSPCSSITSKTAYFVRRSFMRGPMSREFLPTPEQIRAECKAIRAEWSPEERAKREGERGKAVRIPVVRTAEIAADAAHCLLGEP
jgi:hypothetical protein